MCGGTCYWRDEARFLRIELDNESREREETETYVAMLESQKAESDLRLEDVANQLVNAHEEIEKLRLELETTYEGYVALDDLYMQRIAEDAEECQDDAIEALLSEARFREIADNAEAEAVDLNEEIERTYSGVTKFDEFWESVQSGDLSRWKADQDAFFRRHKRPDNYLVETDQWVKLPPLPNVYAEASDGDQEVFHSGDWFVFSEYERDRLEQALAEKLADVAELTAIRNKMIGK